MKIAAIYCRVSTEDQEKEGTSLDTQLEACLKYCHDKSYDVAYCFSETYSGQMLERPKLNELRELVRNEQIDIIVCYCLDRLSRDPNHGVILQMELEKHNVTLEAVTETVDSSQLGKLISYIRGFASKLEAEKIRERTMRGKQKCAQLGKIPSGLGRYNGYLGLKYNPKTNSLEATSQIDIAKEILRRGLVGQSTSSIARDLQAKGVRGLGGNVICRSGVNRVLKHSHVYAGVINWNGFNINDKVTPIISINEADQILLNLQRKKEQSFGFGRRKWLTGRVFCGLCGRRYNLDLRKGCRCNGADKRNPTICAAPRLGFQELNALAFGTMCLALSEPEAVVEQAKKAHGAWESEMIELQQSQRRQQGCIDEREKRRRLLSLQHENGGLSDTEYLARLSNLKKETEQYEKLDFSVFIKPEPPTAEEVAATYDRLKAYKPLRQHHDKVMQNPHDKFADDIAEAIGFKIVIGPPKTEGDKYSAQVLFDLPIPDWEVPFPFEDFQNAMVLLTSEHCVHQRQPLP